MVQAPSIFLLSKVFVFLDWTSWFKMDIVQTSDPHPHTNPAAGGQTKEDIASFLFGIYFRSSMQPSSCKVIPSVKGA